jgi:hypothetical protein
METKFEFHCNHQYDDGRVCDREITMEMDEKPMKGAANMDRQRAAQEMEEAHRRQVKRHLDFHRQGL